jgi:uncharacterized membrane protein
LVGFENPTAFIGMLVIFLIIGVIGLMVGDSIIQSTNATNSPTAATVIQVFTIGVTFCKIVIAASGVGIIYKILQQAGIIPKSGSGHGGSPPG